jgi:FkbH-like protein
VILALCSKNNPEDALEVLDRHPHMLLRREHFAAMRINWQEKALNLQEIARELNIGLDSLVFLDDNPVEVARVRRQVPEVLAYQLPRAPERYAAFLAGLPVFEVLSLTEEDRRRGEEYRQQAQRRHLESSCTSLEEFYRKLEMRANIAPATPATLPRIAQLTQKTNQFNLTTRRYTEAEIAARLAAGEWQVYTLELEDRFGKSGLVAVGILRPEGDAMWIDTFLMSCRVMSRTVEQTFLHHLATVAARQGYRRLIGEYIRTAKNNVVADFYPSQGFTPVRVSQTGSVWALPLHGLTLRPSPYIDVIHHEERVTWT